MKKNLIPTIIVIGLIPFFFWTSCISEEIKLARQKADSLERVQFMRFDSIQRAKYSITATEKRVKDSIASAEKKYRNRPWKLDYFVDDFGESTNRKYIETYVDGLFSNSAVSNRYLYTNILITKTSVGIFLHEYNRSSPAKKFIGKVTIRMKNSNGVILDGFTFDIWSKNGGICIHQGDYYYELRDLLKKSVGKIKVVIRDEYSSRYNFTIDATGFSREFNLL